MRDPADTAGADAGQKPAHQRPRKPAEAGEFELATGRALDLPVTEDVACYRVWLEGDDVVADLGPTLES